VNTLKALKFLLPAALLMSSAAYAADVVVVETPEPVIVDSYNWSGIYIGVNGGYGGGDFKHPFSIEGIGESPIPDIDGSLDFTAGGFVGGAQVGYNWQSGQFVFGVEADIQAADVKGEASLDLDIDDLGGGSAEIGTQLDYFGTIRGRIGYVPVERLLVYGTGGFAYGRTESYLNASIDGGPDLADLSEKKNRTGWTIGAGAEYAFTDNWSLKTEYLYTDLGKETLFSEDFGIATADLESDVKFHTVRAGLNWKF
jgi:outer membrane immunogenic protein